MSIYSQVLGYPDTAGFAFSWPSVEISIGGFKKVVASKSIRYSDPLQIGKAYGTSTRPIVRTRGQSAPVGSWEMLRSAWDMLCKDVLAIGGKLGFAEQAFPIFVSYAEPSNPLLTVTDQLLGTRIHSPEAGGSEGPDPLLVTVQLDIMEIVWGKGAGAPGVMQLSPLNEIVARRGAVP